MRFLYTSAYVFFWLESLSNVLCFALYSSLSFDAWLLDLNLFIACGTLLMDFLFPNGFWEIPKLWNALKDQESVTYNWDSKNEVEVLSGIH
jgi:hypothetical protein